MNGHNVHLLDLPNEILFLILEKLNNVDVLYSFLGINNQRLDIMAQKQTFTNILNFVSISQSTNQISSISDSIFNRFCMNIIPKIHQNVRSITVESLCLERILGAGIYPNLTELKIYNFTKTIVSHYFNDDSLIGHICKQQITDLVLVSNDSNIEITLKEYSKDVYGIIFIFFQNLKRLSILPSSMSDYSPLSLYISPPLTFSSSTLIKLCINVNDFDDCLALLDGRFKQLTTFIVQVNHIYDWTETSYNMDDLPHLKCFSLICYDRIRGYNNMILPLLRRMSYLEELTLYLHILDGSLFISGNHLDSEILIHMPRLHTFTFYFASENDITHPSIHICNSDIQRTFTNTKYGQVTCMADYYQGIKTICRVFSYPFRFRFLDYITNDLPNLPFESVTQLKLNDKYPFKHEFFIRLTELFPHLQNLSIDTILAPNWRACEFHLHHTDWCSIVQFPHLISLDIKHANCYYAEHFLNETKAHLPCLTELKIRYGVLEMVTTNFTKNETRRICAQVKRLIVEYSMVYPKDLYDYFPLLSF